MIVNWFFFSIIETLVSIFFNQLNYPRYTFLKILPFPRYRTLNSDAQTRSSNQQFSFLQQKNFLSSLFCATIDKSNNFHSLERTHLAYSLHVRQLYIESNRAKSSCNNRWWGIQELLKQIKFIVFKILCRARCGNICINFKRVQYVLQTRSVSQHTVSCFVFRLCSTNEEKTVLQLVYIIHESRSRPK